MAIDFSDLKVPVTFYEYVPNDSPEPGEKEKRTLHISWAKVDQVWLKDMELAKSNGTLTDLTIIIRDPLQDYVPTNKHYVSIDDLNYRDNRYNVKNVMPDIQDKRFITIVAELSS